MDIKKKYALTETSLGISKFCFIVGTIFGGIAVLIAATIPNHKPKLMPERRSYL